MNGNYTFGRYFSIQGSEDSGVEELGPESIIFINFLHFIPNKSAIRI
jgi:hypothetical protein